MIVVAVVAAGCSTTPPGARAPKHPSTAFAQPADTQLGRQFETGSETRSGKSAFRIISSGIDGFAAREQLIGAAAKSLDLQYYIFHQDQTGGLITRSLLQAADRGVHVRLLVDDGETRGDDGQVRLLSAHANIEVRVFNPLAYRGSATVIKAGEFVISHRRVDFRMHNKLFIADGAVALIGGRNVGDQYFQIDPKGQFADDDLFVGGPIVRQLSGSFDDYWNSALAIPIEALSKPPASTELARYREALDQQWHKAELSKADYVERAANGVPLSGITSGTLPVVWADAVLVCDSPERKLQAGGATGSSFVYQPLVEAASAVKTELLMVTPYFVPTPQELELLKSLRDRDVRVRILTNSLASTTEPAAHAGYARYRVQLLQMGVELFEVRPDPQRTRGSGQSSQMSSFGNFGLHAKLYVFDREKVLFGSMNFDQRSSRLNTEIGLIVSSPELGEETLHRFQAMTQPSNAYEVVLENDKDGKPRLIWRTQDAGNTVEYAKEPSRGAWQTARARILGILPIEREL